MRNVIGHLPKAQHEQARSTLRTAWKLEADEGIRKVEQYAAWVEREWPSAAASLRGGLTEMFTVNRLGLPQALRRCLTTTNIIESSNAGVRQHTRRVSRWRNGEMAVRWAATTFYYRRDALTARIARGRLPCHSDAHWYHSRSPTSSRINSTELPGRPPCPTPWSSGQA